MKFTSPLKMYWPQQALLMAMVLVCTSRVVSSTYVVDKKDKTRWDKTNSITDRATPLHSKRYESSFRNDEDIHRYLKLYGEDYMLWRCKNAIQPYWNWKPLPVLELYCETVGVLRAISWYHNGQKISLGGRYGQYILPHLKNGQFFAHWIDFKLQIYNATMKDSGLYTFETKGVKGDKQRQLIYVDISEKKKRKVRQKMRKLKKRKYGFRGQMYQPK